MKKIAFFALVCFFLVACQSQIEVTEEALPAFTSVSSPQHQEEVTEESILVFLPSQELTQTPNQSASVITQLDLPAWMANSETSVLMFRMLGENFEKLSSVTFLNPQTGERYELDMADSFMCWHDNLRAVFVHYPEYINVLDVSNGLLTRYDSQDPNFETFLCDTGTEYSAPRYSFDFDGEQSEKTIVLVDSQTGVFQTFTNSNDGIYDVGATYSENYVAILQTDKQETLSSVFPAGNQISIYAFDTKNLVMVIQDGSDLSDMWFLPDGNKLIYRKNLNMPCVVSISSQETLCNYSISDAHPDSMIYFSEVTADRKQMIFYYFGRNAGGLCFFDFDTNNLRCPTNGLAILDDQAVTDYLLSPDERYIVFTYEEDSCPICDTSGLHPGLAVIGYSGEYFWDLGVSNATHGIISLVAAWRPILTGEITP